MPKPRSVRKAPAFWLVSSTSGLNSFDFKYYNLKYNIFDVLNKLLTRFFEFPEETNFTVANAIFRFYSELNTAFIVKEISPFLLGFIQKCERRDAYVFFSLEGVRVF